MTIVTKNSHHNKNMQSNHVNILGLGISFSVDNTFNLQFFIYFPSHIFRITCFVIGPTIVSK